VVVIRVSLRKSNAEYCTGGGGQFLGGKRSRNGNIYYKNDKNLNFHSGGHVWEWGGRNLSNSNTKNQSLTIWGELQIKLQPGYAKSGGGKTRSI